MNAESVDEQTRSLNIGAGQLTSAVQNVRVERERLWSATTDGGDKVQELFAADVGALHQIYQVLASGGDSVWVDGTDKQTNSPVRYVALDDGNTFLTSEVFVDKTALSTLEEGSEKGAGIGYVFLSLTRTIDGVPVTTQLTAHSLDFVGPGISSIDPSDGLKDMITKTLGVFTKFIKKVVGLASEGSQGIGPAAAGAAAARDAKTAATASAARGESVAVSSSKKVVMDIEIPVAEAVGLVIGLGQLAVGIILEILSKSITSYVRFYNITGEELEFSISWLQPENAVAAAPMVPLSPIALPGTSPAWTPPWVIGDDPIHFIEMVIVNTDRLKGVSYVLRARPAGDFPGCSVMVDIPNTGGNTLAVELGRPEAGQAFHQQHEDDPSLSTVSTTAEGYSLKASINSLKGRTPAPTDGALGYNYETLIVLEQTNH